MLKGNATRKPAKEGLRLNGGFNKDTYNNKGMMSPTSSGQNKEVRAIP